MRRELRKVLREKMREAAAFLVGEHDFSSFCSAGSQAETKVRRITELAVEEEGTRVAFRITGTGFLYNMVRIIAGTLLRVGTGIWPPEKVKEILEAKDPQAAGPKAPAEGLCLMEIRLFPEGFPEEITRTWN